MLFRTVSLVALLFCFCLSCSAADYYVDVNNPAASDSNPGTQSLPWKTINQAIHTLSQGDIAYVLPGTYDISSGPFVETGLWPFDDAPLPALLRPVNSGTVGSPIRVIALSTASQIIGGGNSPSAQDDAHQAFLTNGLVFVDKDYWRFEGFYVKSAGGFYSARNKGFVLKDSLVFVDPATADGVQKGGGHGISFYKSNDSLIDHCEIWSINFDAYRQMQPPQDDPLETQSTLVATQLSWHNVVANSILYGGRNNLQGSQSRDCLVENNTIFWGQEHNGAFCANNFTFRRNIWYPSGQGSPYLSFGCSDYGVNGTIENNEGILTPLWAQSYCPSDHWHDAVDRIVFRNNLVYNRAGPTGSCIYAGPEYGEAFDSDYNGCSNWRVWSTYPVIPAGYFWRLWSPYWTDVNDWITSHTSSPYSLPAWQAQADLPQPLQDPHSMFGFDPKLVTPHLQLGQRENDDYNCNLTFGPQYNNATSNCEPPYRMRILDDLRLLPDSPLRNAGDPAYGPGYPGGRIDIGAIEYGGAAAPTPTTFPSVSPSPSPSPSPPASPSPSPSPSVSPSPSASPSPSPVVCSPVNSTQNCTVGGCNGTQACTGGFWGACVKFVLCCGVNCDDGNSCTADSCVAATGVCSHSGSCPAGGSPEGSTGGYSGGSSGGFPQATAALTPRANASNAIATPNPTATPVRFVSVPQTNEEVESALLELPADDSQTSEARQIIAEAKNLESQGKWDQAKAMWAKAKEKVAGLLAKARTNKAAYNYYVAGLAALLLVGGAVYYSSTLNKPKPPATPPGQAIQLPELPASEMHLPVDGGQVQGEQIIERLS